MNDVVTIQDPRVVNDSVRLVPSVPPIAIHDNRLRNLILHRGDCKYPFYHEDTGEVHVEINSKVNPVGITITCPDCGRTAEFRFVAEL